jgi:hypothetical protein
MLMLNQKTNPLTICCRICGNIVKRLVDIEDNQHETRKAVSQPLRCGIKPVIEGNCINVQPFHTLVATQTKYCHGCWQASHWGQCCHSYSPCSQCIQPLSPKKKKRKKKKEKFFNESIDICLFSYRLQIIYIKTNLLVVIDHH